jgi:hypothetical protein
MLLKMQHEMEELTMSIRRLYTSLCFIPFICVLPLFGMTACGGVRTSDTGTDSLSAVGQTLVNIHENARVAAPYLKEDLEKLWNNVAGGVQVYAEDLGVGEPPHELVQAEEARERLISGASLEEVLSRAATELTPEDLQQMPSQDLNVLNGVLPFEIDLTTCGENLAEVLNNLDIGQVSAILKSEAGYHLIQVVDRDGMRLKIGHIVFQVIPPAEDQVIGPPAQNQ